ncbi:hypothetical protein [Sorangium sp. So ce542]|uniref:hypothetical protein n=1 Tax=Sorangium sp. So ce542 TaxID=3133316 RepID=UPI003F62B7B7
MNQEKSVFPICGLALSSFLALGCFFEVKDGARPRPQPSSMGSLTVEWTVNRRSEPRACARFSGGRTDFELIIYRGDEEVAREYARCEDFVMTVDLPPDEYRAYATLVERRDERPVTTTLPLEQLDIVSGAALNIDVDFPANSFL